ncbi:MAG: SpoIID/LytB domain-containing protein [Nocardiopsis sp. BM-2018]|nr:MAG: SpoIID/LytB domain-containing protein [Nocardiopsis sp. BM-2018]
MHAPLLRGCLVACALACLTVASAQPLVRVLLDERVGVAQVRFDGAHRGAIDGRPFATPFALAWTVSAQDGRLFVDARAVGRQLDLSSDAGSVTWDGRSYRGSLRLLARGDALLVINVVELEAYLRGVVPAEMQASWPLEALRAQAVAARTYTMVNLDGNAPFDVCATSDCQVYRGMGIEHPRTDQAIADTAGQVLTFGGAFARTYYHADSGGVIASAAEVWGMSLPYLSAFRDVASDGPHARWDARLDPTTVAAHLAAAGHHVGAVQRVRIVAYSESGRVSGMEVVGSAGRVTVHGLAARLQARAWGLKSTRFEMTGDLSVRGWGWGHGVGMSQYGARALALSGYAYGQILAFYYPDTHLQRLTTVAAR